MGERIILPIAGVVRNLPKKYEERLDTKAENSMIITDRRIILTRVSLEDKPVKVPVKSPSPVKGKTPTENKITDKQWPAIQKEMGKKLDDLISSAPLGELLKKIPSFSINLTDIKKISIHDYPMKMEIKLKDGKEYSYTIWNDKVMEELKIVFKNYLSSS